MNARWKSHLLLFWRDCARPILVMLIVLCSFRSAIADWNDVPTGSMKPTILEGDRIFVNKMAYGLRVPFTRWRLIDWDRPHRGDVVVFIEPKSGERMVKRVIGLPGDRVRLVNNVLTINGKAATYAPADDCLSDTAGGGGFPGQLFAEEDLDGTVHSVLITPRIRSRRNFGPIVIAEDHYFFMGDNRDLSRDSRWFGCIERSAIVGKALGIVLSLDPDHHHLPRWSRTFRGMR